MTSDIDDAAFPESIRRALAGSALRTPEVGRRFVRWMLFLLSITFLGQLAIFSGMSLSASRVYALGLILATLSSLPAIALIRYLDRRERESPWLLSGALLWGAVIGTGLASVLNAFGFGLIALTEAIGFIDIPSSESAATILTAIAVAPPIEELTKGLGVLLLFWFLRAEFDNMRDGMVYGGLIGLGFLIAEYSVYLVSALQDSGNPPYLELLALRNVFFGLNYHTIWTALFGAGIGLARQTSSRSIRLAAPFAFYLLAVFFHGLNNSAGVILVGLFFGFSGVDLEASIIGMALPDIWLSAALMNILVQFWAYAILAFLLVKSEREEIEIIRSYLADEVNGSVTSEEYSLIKLDSPFRTRRIPGYAGRKEMAIINAQNELAFRKWHLAREGGDPEKDLLVQAWRRDIARLRRTESADGND